MKRYQNIGQLLSDLKILNEKSKNQMSEWVGIGVRTYSRWEKNESKPIDDNLKDLAERTKIPYEVLFRLNQGYPTLYNIVTRRYAQCPFDKDYVNRKILQEELFDTDEQGYISSLSTDRDINMVLDSLFPVYLNNEKVSSEVMRHTFNIFPELNLIIKDPIGFYSGHVICFPLTLEKYEHLRANKKSEALLTHEDIIQPPWDEPVALHIYSFFASSSTYAYCFLKRMVRYILINTPDKLNTESIISRYAVTKDGIELCKKMGMKIIYAGYEDQTRFNTEALPHFFEAKIGDLEWLNNYREKILN